MAELKIKADSGGGTVALKGPATTTSNAAVQLTLPVDDGTANQYLKTDGSGALSWATVSAGTALTGSTNNTVCTVTGADAIQGEAGLTFDGSHLQVSAAEGQACKLSLYSDEGDDNADKWHILNDNGFWFENYAAGSWHTSAKFAGNGGQEFYHQNALSFSSGANGLVLPSGKGIDFSAAAGSNAGSSSALLDDYEEGTFTATWSQGVTGGSYTGDYGTYIKNGNLVNVWVKIAMSGASATSSTIKCVMPFTSFNSSTAYGGTVWYYNNFKTMADPLHVWLGGNTAEMQFHTTTGSNFVGTSADDVNQSVFFHVIYRSA